MHWLVLKVQRQNTNLDMFGSTRSLVYEVAITTMVRVYSLYLENKRKRKEKERQRHKDKHTRTHENAAANRARLGPDKFLVRLA